MINCSIITIGDELLIGQTIDTNSAFIGQEFNKIGVWVRRRVAVGDNYKEIWNALDEESKESEIIIITGGLGPTADDITKPLLCDYFGGKMIVNEKVLAHVHHLFKNVFNRQGPMLESNLKQAEVPDTCTILHNEVGTAPGMLFKKNNKVFISLPGVPHEMKWLITHAVIPFLLNEYKMPAIVHCTALTVGQGESYIASLLKDFESTLPSHIKLAYLPNYGMVKLRLTATGIDKVLIEKVVATYFIRMQEIVNEFLVTNMDESLEVVIGNILKSKNKTMGTAESCTGGYISHLITSVAGSSAYFNGSIVSYSNIVKENVLDVNQITLEKFGAVSEETVKEMLTGALRVLGVDYAIAVSGIMGPGGGSEEKPVGTVWVAVGNGKTTETLRLNLRFDRRRNINLTATYALNFLRKFILNEERDGF